MVAMETTVNPNLEKKKKKVAIQYSWLQSTNGGGRRRRGEAESYLDRWRMQHIILANEPES